MAKKNVPKKAKDPICGMTVDTRKAAEAGLTFVKDNKVFYFCNAHCKETFSGAKRLRWLPWLLTLILGSLAYASHYFDFMLEFMGGVFLIISLLKIIDWNGFVERFVKYDIVAKRIPVYAWAYPAMELLLGLCYLFAFALPLAAIVTIFIMVIGAIGIALMLAQKPDLKCACLGAKVPVPLTWFTLFEDILMAFMALLLLI